MKIVLLQILIRDDDNFMANFHMASIKKYSNINSNGHIFGGWILSQMDSAGGVEAIRRVGGPVATVAIEPMKFHAPINVGDWMSVYTDITKVGTTSLTIHIEVTVLSRETE
jgi:acyl-CoA thioesterase YciA